MFLHNLFAADGVQSVAQFKKEILFRDYRISSQNDDRIAFAIDPALLHRALRSALTIQLQSGDDTAAIQIKLVKKLPAGSRNPAPFLTFETKGLRSAVVQDVPISKPLSRADVLQLQAALDAAQDLPQVHIFQSSSYLFLVFVSIVPLFLEKLQLLFFKLIYYFNFFFFCCIKSPIFSSHFDL